MTPSPQKKTQIISRRQRVAELYLRGKYQADIAEEMGVDQATISRDLAELRKEWLDRSVNHIEQKKAVELAKIDQLEITYWEAWERSLEDAAVEVVEQIGTRLKPKKQPGSEEPAEPAILPERIKKYRRVEGQSGNPAFLAGVQWCINKRCEILGLEAPKRADITSGGKPINEVVDDERFNRAISSLADAIRKVVPGSSAEPESAVDAAE